MALALTLGLPVVYQDHQVSGDAKLLMVRQLIKELRDDLEHITLLPQERNSRMEQLKIFGRVRANADPIFTPEGIEVLTYHSFHSTSPTTSRAALECLANALLLEPTTRQMFVDLGYSAHAVKRLKKPKKDDEFLISRLIFLTSYGTTQKFETLIDKNKLAEHIIENIERHANNRHPTTKDDDNLSETLKLQFNITHFCAQRASKFSKSIAPIIKLISQRRIQEPPLAAPTCLLVNALSRQDLEDEKKALKSSPLKACVDKLVRILDASLRVYKIADLDKTVAPLLHLLKLLAKTSPPAILAFMKGSLLPGVAQKSAPMTPDSEKLQVRLMDLVKNPRTVASHDAVAALFFMLAGEDTSQFGGDFAMGLSAGFFMTRNLQLKKEGSDIGPIPDMTTKVVEMDG